MSTPGDESHGMELTHLQQSSISPPDFSVLPDRPPPASPPSRPPPEMPGSAIATEGAAEGVHRLAGASPQAMHCTSPKSPAVAAAERIGKRYKEMLESECALCEDMQQLLATLDVLAQDKAWKLRPEHVKLIHRTKNAVHALLQVHSAMREKMAMFAGTPVSLTEIFSGSDEEMVTVHGEFQTLSTCVMVVLQKKAGGKVMGDKAVGTSVKTEGSLAAALAPIHDLLVRPSQRVMKYSLFLEEMAADARRSEQTDLEKTLQEAVKVVRGIAMDINERIRSIQRRERVTMIAARVRAVPLGMNIVKDGREFVMDDHFFRERETDDRGHIKGRAGYRHLYLFNDAVLVCKPGEGILGKLFKANDCDLKFKRLIPLTSLKISDYPTLCEPSAPGSGDSPESPGGLQTMPYFELHDGLGKCSFHHTDREKVEEWVAALHETLRKLEERKQQGPVPAYRLPNSQEDIAMLSEDLSGLDLSDYVLLDPVDYSTPPAAAAASPGQVFTF